MSGSNSIRVTQRMYDGKLICLSGMFFFSLTGVYRLSSPYKQCEIKINISDINAVCQTHSTVAK